MPRVVQARRNAARSLSLSMPGVFKASLRQRYRSFNTSRLDSDACPTITPRILDPSLPSPRVPLEVIERILEFLVFEDVKQLLHRDASSMPFSNSVSAAARSFARIAHFSLASTAFRKMALRHHFSTLILRNLRQSLRIGKFLLAQGLWEGFTWVKFLHMTSNTFTKAIKLFTRLQTVSIDFGSEGMVTQHPAVISFFNHLRPVALTTLSSLTLTRLTYIDVPLLSLIALNLKTLTVLYLSCTEGLDLDCCWTCLEESSSCAAHSPIPDMYADIQGLATAYAQALQPLTRIRDLHLGVYLSSETDFNLHLRHGPALLPLPMSRAQTDLELDSTQLESRLDTCVPLLPPSIDYGGSSFPPYLPTNCSICFLTSAVTTQHELVASLLLAQRIPTLERIGWSSFFPPADMDESGLRGWWGPDRRVKISVERHSAGRVKVKRMIKCG